MPQNSGAKKEKAPGLPLGPTQELLTCQTQPGGGCLTIYLTYGIKCDLDHFKENPSTLGGVSWGVIIAKHKREDFYVRFSCLI